MLGRLTTTTTSTAKAKAKAKAATASGSASAAAVVSGLAAGRRAPTRALAPGGRPLWSRARREAGTGGYQLEPVSLPRRSDATIAAASRKRPLPPPLQQSAPANAQAPAQAQHQQPYYSMTLGHKAVAPFLAGTILMSTYFFAQRADADLVAAAGPEEGEAAQALGLFALYRYIELSTVGPRFDLSGLASLVDWQKLLALAPTRPAQGLVHSCYAALMHGVDNTVALFPSIDIRPKLIRLGLLDTLEAALQAKPQQQDGDGDEDPGSATSLSSTDPSTVQLCAAYVANRLSRNAQCARALAARPAIVEALLALADAELLVREDGRLEGFRHSESSTSAEVFLTLLEALGNIAHAAVDKGGFLFGDGDGGGAHAVTGSSAAAVLAPVQPQLVEKLAATLRHLELCDEHVGGARGVFRDQRMAIHIRFYPATADGELRRRMREIEAEVCRFLCAVSKDRDACDRLLLRRDVLQAVASLAVSEVRNGSAFLPAVECAHNVMDRAAAARLLATEEQDEEVAEEDDVDMDSRSLLVDSHLNRRALEDAAALVVPREEGTLGAPFARLRSVEAMRCYVSSMACLVAGGVYGAIRTAAAAGPMARIHPLVAYSVNGVGAVVLNVLYGTYGLRHYLKAHTYIEDDAANVAWTWAQAGLDVAVVTAVVRRHPFALLPFVAVNMLGHSSYPGTGLKALDGLDIFGLG